MNRTTLLRLSIAAAVCLGLGGLAYHQYNRITAFRVFCNFLRRAWQYAREEKHSELFAAPTFIKGKQLCLRKLTWKDCQEYSRILCDKEVTRPFFMEADGKSYDIPPWFYMCKQLTDQLFGFSIVYLVVHPTEGYIGGMIEITRDRPWTRNHIYGFASPKYQGKNARDLNFPCEEDIEALALKTFSEETVNLAIKTFFTITTARAVNAQVVPQNKRCQAFLLKHGFKPIKSLQDPRAPNDLVFSLQRADYEQAQQHHHTL